MKLPLTLLKLIAFLWMLVIQGTASAASCTHYASPTGTGIGTTSAQPFKIANFWPLAKPGYTLCLLDGKYTGSASMINPPKNLSGTASAPITVRALNDGKVTINGQGNLNPARLYYNNYFVLEGFNAHHGQASVVSLSYSNHNIVRRITGWDAADGNTNIFSVNSGSHNLLEDIAGWGIARKTFSASQGGNYTTIRRAWGRWEGSHVTGPKMTYTLAYNNYNFTCENCIGTWSGERMKQSYTLEDYYGQAYIGRLGGTYDDYQVNSPYGVFGVDNLDEGDKNAHIKLLGSIAYVRRSDRFAPNRAIFVTKMDSVEIANTIAYIEPGSYTSTQPFLLSNTAGAVNLIAKNLTAIGGASSYIHSDWKKSSISEGPSLSSVANVFTGTGGANICYRYKGRVLTTEPLWPWPMNQRIMNAMIESGRAAVDVTKTIENLFGSIPSVCKTDGSPIVSAPSTTKPAAPVNLLVNP